MINNKTDINSELLQEKITEWGADLAGFASLDNSESLKVYPTDLLKHYKNAVSVAIELPKDLFDQEYFQPNASYAACYKATNQKLDEITNQIAKLFEEHGYNSLAIPASEYVDDNRAYGAISHKAVGYMAGLGWLGKNQLLLTRQFGPRVRLATVLSDAPFSQTSFPEKNRCLYCTACLDACPVGALSDVPIGSSYVEIQKSFCFSKCHNQVYKFAELPEIGEPICGICINACPFS